MLRTLAFLMVVIGTFVLTQGLFGFEGRTGFYRYPSGARQDISIGAVLMVAGFLLYRESTRRERKIKRKREKIKSVSEKTSPEKESLVTNKISQEKPSPADAPRLPSGEEVLAESEMPREEMAAASAPLPSRKADDHSPIDPESVRQRYRSLSTDDLKRLYKEDGLTYVALEILGEELKSRGSSIIDSAESSSDTPLLLP